MKILKLDIISGISGDMILGAFINAGLPVEYLKDTFKKMRLKNYNFNIETKMINGIKTTDVKIESNSQPLRHLPQIEEIILSSNLSEFIKNFSLKVFKILAEAEAKVHNISVNKVHFHEVGAIDTILDIVGAACGLEYFKIDKVYSSPVKLGKGFVNTMHGLLPVPAPATVEILKGMPVEFMDINEELVTPTGSAILKSFSPDFSPLQFHIETAGYGAGDKELNIPNFLRIFIGTLPVKSAKILSVETNVDDISPQIGGYIVELLLKNGALDVYIYPYTGKKSRPGFKIEVLTNEDNLKKIMDILFKETTTTGIRVKEVNRIILKREEKEINTKYGKIRAKVAYYEGEKKIIPEYEECKILSQKFKVPLIKIIEEVKRNETEI